MLSLCFVLALMLAMGSAGWAANCDSVQQYKMQSLLEYSGRTQFCNKAETVLTAKKHLLSDGKARYVLSAEDFKGLPSPLKELSFVIDRKTQHLSGADENLALMERVTNHCATSLKEVSSENVGKTWKQTFDLSSIGNSVPGELKFTLTAMPIETKTYGSLIAVRALSELFVVEITGGTAQCRMNCAYVFCSGFEDIFMSASVFGAATNCNGYGEGLKHTVITWKVDDSEKPARFDELGESEEFAKLISKLGVTKPVEIVKTDSLPQWAKSDGIRTAQVANLCASISCEGALNPVATIYLPAASTVGLQSFSESLTLNKILTGAEGSELPAPAGGEELVWWPPWANIGLNWPTAAWATGLTATGLWIGGEFQSDHHHRHRSPVTP